MTPFTETAAKQSQPELIGYFGSQYIIADLTIKHKSLDKAYTISDARIRSYKSAAIADRGDIRGDYTCHYFGEGMSAWLSREFIEKLAQLELKLVNHYKPDSELQINEVRLGSNKEVRESNARTVSNGYKPRSRASASSKLNQAAEPQTGCALQASELDEQFRKLAKDCGMLDGEAWKMLRDERGLSDPEILHAQYEYGFFSYSDEDVFKKDLRVVEGFPGSWWDEDAKTYRPNVIGQIVKGRFIPNLKARKVYNQKKKQNEWEFSKNSCSTAQKLFVVASNSEGQRIGAQWIYTDPTRRGKSKYRWTSHDLAPSRLFYPFDAETPLERPEQPIPFFRPMPRNNKETQGRDFCLAGCEGFLKAAIASLQQGVKFLGAAAGLQASSPVQFERALAKARSECVDLQARYHESQARIWKKNLLETAKALASAISEEGEEKNKGIISYYDARGIDLKYFAEKYKKLSSPEYKAAKQDDQQKMVNNALRKINKELLDYARDNLQLNIKLRPQDRSDDLFLYLDCLDAGVVENKNIIGDLLKGSDWKRNKPLYDANKSDGNLKRYNRVGATCHFVRKLGYNYFVNWYEQVEKEVGGFTKKRKGDIDEVDHRLSHALASSIEISTKTIKEDYALGRREVTVNFNRESNKLISFEYLIERAKAAQLFKRMTDRQLGLTTPGKTKYEAIVEAARKFNYEIFTAEEKDFKDKAGRFVGVRQFVELADVPRGSLSVLPFAMGLGKTAAAESLASRKREESQQMLKHFEMGLDYCKRWELNFLDPAVFEQLFDKSSREYLYLIGRNYRDIEHLKQDIRLFKLGVIESFESIYSIGARNSLQSQTANRCGIGFKPEIMLKNNGDKRCLKVVKSLSFCLDSALDIEEYQVAGADLLIDEFEGVVAHGFLGSTCKANREKIANRARQLIRTCLKTGGRVFLMGAGINILTLEVLEAWLKDDEIPLVYDKYFFGSDYKKEDRKWNNCKLLDGSVKYSDDPDANNNKVLVGDPMAIIYGALEQLREGKKVKLHVDKKEYAQIFHFLANSLGYHGLCYTSDDGEDTGKYEFMADPNGFLEAEKKSASPIQYLVSSPMFPSGLSITVDYFDYVFGIFFGVISTDDILQTLSRVRVNIDRYVWVANNAGRGMALPENLTDLDKASRLFEEGQVLKHGKQLFHLAYNQIKIGKLIEAHSDRKSLEEELEELLKQPDGYTPDNIAYESINKTNRYNSIQAKLIADRNRDSFCYRRLAKHKLADLAKDFEIIDDPQRLAVPVDFWGHWDKAKEEVRYALAQAIANARDIDKEEAMQLSKQELTDIADKNALRKYLFKRDTHCDIEPEVEVILELLINGNGSKLKQLRAVAEINNPVLSTAAKMPEYFFRQVDNEGEVLRADLPPTFGTTMNKLGAAELLENPYKTWSSSELNELFRERFKTFEAQKQGTLFGVYADRYSSDYGANIASQLLRKLGFYFNKDESGYYSLSTKKTFDSPLWKRAYPAVVNRLKQEAFEAIVAIRTHFDNTQPDGNYILDLPWVAPAPMSTFDFVPETVIAQQQEVDPPKQDRGSNYTQLGLGLFHRRE